MRGEAASSPDGRRRASVTGGFRQALGWARANGGSLNSDSVARPVYDALQKLDALGVFELNRWNRTGVTTGGRAFAHSMLLSPVP